MNLTRREKLFLIIAGILAIIFTSIPQETIDQWETTLLFVIVGPLGFMIATDPERIRKGE